MKGHDILDKQTAINDLNEIKEKCQELENTGDVLGSSLYYGKYIGMAFAYVQCGILTPDEHSDLLDEIN